MHEPLGVLWQESVKNKKQIKKGGTRFVGLGFKSTKFISFQPTTIWQWRPCLPLPSPSSSSREFVTDTRFVEWKRPWNRPLSVCHTVNKWNSRTDHVDCLVSGFHTSPFQALQQSAGRRQNPLAKDCGQLTTRDVKPRRMHYGNVPGNVTFYKARQQVQVYSIANL